MRNSYDIRMRSDGSEWNYQLEILKILLIEVHFAWEIWQHEMELRYLVEKRRNEA